MITVEAVLLLLTLITMTAADNLALLSGTLKTYQKAACDEEMLSLKCPRGTSITIMTAQYGMDSTAGQSLCAGSSPPAGHHHYTPTIVEIVGNSTHCTFPLALQYSLLQTVVEACQKKRQCKFNTSPKNFGGDPCPGVLKYVEVAYKCRPYEFRSKVGCENDVLQMSCNPHSRIAVYSSSFGRTEYESIQCPQPQGVPEETCLVSYATETVMRLCHGKRRCTLSADSTTFGNPCRPDSRMYLKVIYTCVPRKVLKERYEGAPEEDEMPLQEGHDSDDFYDTDPGEDNWYKEPAAIPPAPKVAAGPTKGVEGGGGPGSANSTRSGGGGAMMGPSGMGPEPDGGWQVTHRPSPTASINISIVPEGVLLYLMVGGVAIVALCLCLCIIHCVMKRSSNNEDKAPDISGATDLPHGFGDNISEVDNDIDMTTQSVTIAAVMKPERATATATPPYQEMALAYRPVPDMYGRQQQPPNTLQDHRYIVDTRRCQPPLHQMLQLQDVVVSPRSLNRCSNAQYYYG